MKRVTYQLQWMMNPLITEENCKSLYFYALLHVLIVKLVSFCNCPKENRVIMYVNWIIYLGIAWQGIATDESAGDGSCWP